jgi:hypothetical protein
MKKENKKIKDNKIKDLLLNQKGMALLTTLIFVFIMVTFGVALLTMTSNDTKLSTLQRDSTKAFYLAEAGIEKALWYLNTSKDNGGEGLDWRTDNTELYPEGYFQKPYPVASTNYYQLTVENTAEQDIIKITSKGVVSDGNKVYGSRKIKVIAKKAISPSSTLHYNYAICAESSITIIGTPAVVGDIHSNGTVGGSENIQDINGEITTGGNELYPKIDFDYYKQLATTNGTYFEEGSKPPEFDNGGTIEGIYFIDDDVKIIGDTKLTVHNGTIFSSKSIYLGGNAEITHIKDETYDNPLALIANGDIDLQGKVTTQGVIQSNSTITIGGTDSVLYAAIVADTVILHGTPSINYDPNLQDQVVVGTGIEIYKIISWREIY